MVCDQSNPKSVKQNLNINLSNANWKELSREERGFLISKKSRIIKTPRGWRVPSQSFSGKSYLVKFRGHEPECNCPDCEIRKQKCKHIFAVEFYIKREIDTEGNITQTKGIKISYQQNWKQYDKSQTSEKLFFMKLLSDLCKNVEQPEYKFGRPKLSIQDMIFSSIMKIYTTFSLRRFMSDIKIAKEKGYIDYEPCFASIGHFLQKKELTPILKELIKISSLPFSSVETDFTVDSSGFSTCRFARYFDYKYGREKRYRIWLKANICSGVKTNIVTSVEIMKCYEHDSKKFPKLIKETAKNFKMERVIGDKAYSSRENLKLIDEFGATPFIPFKKNSTARTKSSMIWRKMYHFFLYKHEEFMEHYHKRSNSETVFHMIKTKFRDNLRSKSKTAQINELLCKILCHNICVVIQEVNELGIKADFIRE